MAMFSLPVLVLVLVLPIRGSVLAIHIDVLHLAVAVTSGVGVLHGRSGDIDVGVVAAGGLGSNEKSGLLSLGGNRDRLLGERWR